MSAESLTSRQVPPASSDRNRPPAGASTSAYTRFGLAADTLSPILPIGAAGRPGLVVSSVQVWPPSVDLNIPLPGPPLLSSHGWRTACHSEAYSTCAFDGSSSTSTGAVRSSRNSTRSQLAPPL